MKTSPLHKVIKGAVLLGVVYLLSQIITKQMVSIITLLMVFSFIKFLLKIALSLLFTLIKWVCILGSISLLLSGI